jgi:2-polyprenyl-6-methoxyphenol hydroxylase-like FAD-dependent oxidoreductase
MRVLISGAGVAGPTLAWFLAKHGMEPTLVEQAPALRTGGYIVDFWGAGFEVADRMGIAGELQRLGYTVQEVRVVDTHGRRISGFPAAAFARATGGRFTSLPRGDLAAAVYRAALDRGLETIFGDSIDRIDQRDDCASVTFTSGRTRDFDLVVGADGLHSRVRALLWGAEPRFERYLGYKVAAFEVSGYRPRDEDVYVMYTEVGRQAARFALRRDRTMFLLIFADDDPAAGAHDRAEQEARLRREFGRSGWECPRILEALGSAEELYVDRVSQIRIEDGGGWSRGRVTLVGDAASCVSLLGGQGAALAMTASYLLAGELHQAGGDYVRAFARYEWRFAPFVRRKQEAALRFGPTFAPPSRLSMFVRNAVMNLLAFPGVARLVTRGAFTDRIDLPAY